MSAFNKMSVAGGLLIAAGAMNAQARTLNLPGYLPSSDLGVDYSHMKPATNVAEALAGFDERAKAIIQLYASIPIIKFYKQGLHFTHIANAKLAAGVDVAAVNLALLDPEARAWAKPGSDFHDLSPLCVRTGDYDFTLRGLIPLVYHNQARPDLLWPETRHKIIDQLLTQKGGDFETRVTMSMCGSWPETENHILLTEGSRYLTNQLMMGELRTQGRYDRDYDNAANGMTDRMLMHLQQFFKNDFSEYNSKPYQAYTVFAIQNIYEFAEEPRVKLAAEMLLNYLDAKFAISSNGLRRVAPFRRQKVHKDETTLFQEDAETHRLMQMAGPTALLADLQRPGWMDFGTDRMLFAALGSYRTPEPILDLVINKSRFPYFEAFKHTGVELYTSSKNFLISGGGVYVKKWDWWTGQNSGWARPTTLMPTQGGLDLQEFVRINGHREDEKRVNTCVSYGFACGLNPVVPNTIPAECIEKSGPWTFLNFTAAACPLQYGFHAVVYAAPCDTGACKSGGASFGFFESVEATAALDFQKFKNDVLERNGARHFGAESSNTYINQSGQAIVFRPLTDSPTRWGIESIAGVKMETDLGRWPLGFGSIMNADGQGKVTFVNPALRKRVVLDMRDALHPSKCVEDL